MKDFFIGVLILSGVVGLIWFFAFCISRGSNSYDADGSIGYHDNGMSMTSAVLLVIAIIIGIVIYSSKNKN